MKLNLLFVCLALITVSTSAQAQNTRTSPEQQFIALQRAQDDAEGKKDVAALERIFSDDFIFVAANGSIYDKKKFLDEIKADDEPVSQQLLTYEDFKVRLYGKIALANYLLAVSAKDKDGKDITNRFRMSAAWVKQKGNWRLANIHATRVRE